MLNISTLQIKRSKRPAHRLDTQAEHRACRERTARATEILRDEINAAKAGRMARELADRTIGERVD